MRENLIFLWLRSCTSRTVFAGSHYCRYDEELPTPGKTVAEALVGYLGTFSVPVYFTGLDWLTKEVGYISETSESDGSVMVHIISY